MVDDHFVIRNLPWNLEEEKLKELISTAFSIEETIKIIDFIKGNKDKDIYSRCYVKVTNKVGSKSSEAFLDFMDMRPFINSKGIEDCCALVERVYYIEEIPTITLKKNKFNNTIETSKTYQSFVEDLNNQLNENTPGTTNSFNDHSINDPKNEISLLLSQLLNTPSKKSKSGKSTRSRSKRKGESSEKISAVNGGNGGNGSLKKSSKKRGNKKKQTTTGTVYQSKDSTTTTTTTSTSTTITPTMIMTKK